MNVKICGITTLSQALAAVDAGADMLGFNFYAPSRRYIRPANCARIVAALRTHGHSLPCVGVFVNTSPAQVQHILQICGLDLAQLSGNEPPADLLALDDISFKAVRPASLAEAETALRDYARTSTPALLVDAGVQGSYGGTGQRADATIARHLAAQAPILLAGGLTPENVAAAIRAVQPWGVDVASGVESDPGVKDAARMAAFVGAAQSA